MPPQQLPPLVSLELLEQLGDIVTVVDEQWCYRYVSAGAAALLGRPTSELEGAHMWQLFPELVGTPQHAALVRAMVERTATRTVWSAEPGGLWFEQHAIPTSAGVVVVTDDVTEREDDARRAEQLLVIGEALARTSTVAEVVTVAQSQVLPLVGAAGGGLILIDEARGVAVATGYSGMDAEVDHRWEELPLSLPMPSLDAYRTGRPVFLDDLEAVRERYPHLAVDLERFGHQTVVAFPLASGGQRAGALVASFTHRRLTGRDRGFLATVAAMCAQALARARLFDAEKRSIEGLQRHLLPRSLPTLTHVDVATRYRASTAGVDIGGDWFDAVPLANGAVALVIGDVEGHDVEAAALMGLLRSAVRAYALEGHAPAVILDRTNRFLLGLDAGRLATVCCVQLRPLDHLLTAASAGHLPLLTSSPGTAVAQLPIQVGPPLGVVEERLRWGETTTMVPPGTTLLAFTDGLVEQRGVGIDPGQQRVREALAAASGRSADDVAAAVLAVRPAGNDDDVAVLVARLTAPAPDPGQRRAGRQLPATPASVPLARHFLQQLLTVWAVPPGTVEDAVLAVTELTSNAARHSSDPLGVYVAHTGASIRVDVTDTSHRLPRHHGEDLEATAGRGLMVVEAVCDRWGVELTDRGKTVWCELDLPEPELA